MSDAIPLIPDLETPNKKAQPAAIVKFKRVISDNMSFKLNHEDTIYFQCFSSCDFKAVLLIKIINF
jgi:hypothetical protein